MENEAMETEIVVKVTYDLATIIDAERLSYRGQIWAEVKAGEAVGGQNISMNGAVRRVIDTSYVSPIVDIGGEVKDGIGGGKIDCGKGPIAEKESVPSSLCVRIRTHNVAAIVDALAKCGCCARKIYDAKCSITVGYITVLNSGGITKRSNHLSLIVDAADNRLLLPR